ncbi:MAG: hypothetical protein MJK15_00730 [Colwellia sp.]|nr:hypothetical protein [Colwellia sp.]
MKKLLALNLIVAVLNVTSAVIVHQALTEKSTAPTVYKAPVIEEPAVKAPAIESNCIENKRIKYCHPEGVKI